MLTLESGAAESEVYVTIPVQHLTQWSANKVPAGGIKATFFYGTSMPAAFLVVPPEEPRDVPLPPILALRKSHYLDCSRAGRLRSGIADGAGVDIFSGDRFWIKALPRQRYSWVIAPTGRTEWVSHCSNW